MRTWRSIARSALVALAASSAALIPAHTASAASTLYVCTSGGNFVTSGGVVTLVGEGSCISTSSGAIVPLNYSGSGAFASVPLCLILAPLVEMPTLNVSLTLSPQGGTPVTFAQTWATISPLGAPVYVGSMSGSGTNGLVAGVDISGQTTCGDPIPTQGPFVMTLSA